MVEVQRNSKPSKSSLKKRETQCSDIVLRLKDIIIPRSIVH